MGRMLWMVCLAVLFLAPVGGALGEEGDDTPVLRIGDDYQITRAQLREELNQEPDHSRQKLIYDDNYVRIFAVEWFHRHLYTKAAEEEGFLAKNPGVVAAGEQQKRRSIKGAYIRDLMKRKHQPTEQEIEQYYMMNKADCVSKGRYRLARTGVAIATHASEEERAAAMKRLEAMKQRLAAGDAFETVVEEASDLPGKLPHGEIGWVDKSMLEGFPDHVVNLPLGAVGEPIKTPRGYEIYKMLDRVDPGPMDLERCRPQIVDKLNGGFKRDIAQHHADTLADRYAGTLNLDEFFAAARKVDPPAPQ